MHDLQELPGLAKKVKETKDMHFAKTCLVRWEPPPYSSPTTNPQQASTTSGLSFPASSQSPSTSSRPRASSSEVPAGLSPANFLHISERNAGLKGCYLLDLRLPRPPEGTSAENITLESRNGTVSAEVWVAGSEGVRAHASGSKAGRARLMSSSRNGALWPKLYVLLHIVFSHQLLNARFALCARLQDTARALLTINVKSQNGATSLTLPRDFCGQLTTHTDNGRVSLSKELAARAAVLSTADGTHTYCLGQCPASHSWATGDGKSSGNSVNDATPHARSNSIA
ncbi:hypothetical protein FA95DRAFT_1577104, partial [Auriscalpium vulgare]